MRFQPPTVVEGTGVYLEIHTVRVRSKSSKHELSQAAMKLEIDCQRGNEAKMLGLFRDAQV